MPKARARAKAAIGAGAEGRAGDVAGGSCRSNSQPVANQRPCRRAHGPPQRPTDSHLPVHGEGSIPASGRDRPLAPCSLPQTLRPATAQVMLMTDDRHFRRRCSAATPRTFGALNMLGTFNRLVADVLEANAAAPRAARHQGAARDAGGASYAAAARSRPECIPRRCQWASRPLAPAVNRPDSSALAARKRLDLDRCRAVRWNRRPPSCRP